MTAAAGISPRANSWPNVAHSVPDPSTVNVNVLLDADASEALKKPDMSPRDATIVPVRFELDWNIPCIAHALSCNCACTLPVRPAGATNVPVTAAVALPSAAATRPTIVADRSTNRIGISRPPYSDQSLSLIHI